MVLVYRCYLYSTVVDRRRFVRWRQRSIFKQTAHLKEQCSVTLHRQAILPGSTSLEVPSASLTQLDALSVCVQIPVFVLGLMKGMSLIISRPVRGQMWMLVTAVGLSVR